jgi:hypothetical protein
VRSASIAVNNTTFANARVLPRAALAPTRESLVSGRGRAKAPPQSAFNRNVLAAHQPPAGKPSFAQRQALLQRNAGQPLTTTQMRTLAAHPANASAMHGKSNVRVVGNRGPEIAARTTQRPGNSRATVATQARNAAGSTSPSRSTQQNRAPEKANAQYLRSAGFAHHGVVPGSERSTTAASNRANSAQRASTRSTARADSRASALSSSNSRTAARDRSSARTSGRLNSSTFAHQTGGNRASTQPHGNAPLRAATGEGASHAVTQRSTATSRLRGSSNAQNAQSMAQRSRAAELSRSSNSTRNRMTNAQRASVQRAPSRHVESARERPAFTQRSTPIQRSVRRQEMPVQRSTPQRPVAQAQRMERVAPTHSAPIQRSEPRIQQQVAHSAPQQRAPRQMARQAPQPSQSRGNDRKRDKDGGGRP